MIREGKREATEKEERMESIMRVMKEITGRSEEELKALMKRELEEMEAEVSIMKKKLTEGGSKKKEPETNEDSEEGEKGKAAVSAVEGEEPKESVNKKAVETEKPKAKGGAKKKAVAVSGTEGTEGVEERRKWKR